MSIFSFAFITPSYAPDFQRCKLLCWSIKQFVAFPVKHYIVVEKKDFDLFQQLSNENIIILTKEEILPFWIKRVPFFDRKNIWLNLKGYQSGNFLLRGWLVQQIVKLAAAQYVKEDILIFVDSDVAFINSFDPRALTKGDKARIFRVNHSSDHEFEESRKWKDTAKKLLNLPLENNYYDFYISQIVTWRRDTLIQLYRLLEENFQQDWLEVVTRVKHLSEYVLYGLFVSYVMRENAGHYDDHLQKVCWCYWEERPMSNEELKEFFQEAQRSGHPAVMISAKSSLDLSIKEFQNYLFLSKQGGQDKVALLQEFAE
ncbi:DUF6492 family protein [Leptolyngbya sp. FACHB-711]|uniref:DUF6492 family protein n=1 Tax=unclassified Leptolyngbya TaxID=2650499 RepID=UPI001683CAD3|nr:DUF6492 family protein [Leptolyngbya sp. FACHB-711]MBD1851134.1 hypothetical protein [Cyanobacteria bacterium FACHB-502]MBD2025898.1 hypothetical protein [Leptolyngbya sp. FACHB-711]